VICRVGDARYFGTAVAIDRALDPERVARAVRTGAARAAEPSIEVEAAEAGRLHERVGCIHPECSLRPRTALAMAGRSRGWTTEFDDPLERVRERLAEFAEPPTVPADPGARRQLADATDDIERLRERVAAMRGRAETAGDAGEADLEGAIRSLSEVETTAAAARERRGRVREAAREARDRRQERLGLVDRRDNLARRARRALVDRAREDYVDALTVVPGVRDVADPFDAPADAMALAIARVGDLDAPVVVATDRFADAPAAAGWLDAPVIHLEP
jgi:hypothetical protein